MAQRWGEFTTEISNRPGDANDQLPASRSALGLGTARSGPTAALRKDPILFARRGIPDRRLTRGTTSVVGAGAEQHDGMRSAGAADTQAAPVFRRASTRAFSEKCTRHGRSGRPAQWWLPGRPAVRTRRLYLGSVRPGHIETILPGAPRVTSVVRNRRMSRDAWTCLSSWNDTSVSSREPARGCQTLTRLAATAPAGSPHPSLDQRICHAATDPSTEWCVRRRR